MKFRVGAALLALGLVMVGCGPSDKTAGDAGTSSGGAKPLVAFAQANSGDPWRQVFDAETNAEAEKFKDKFSFELQPAEDDPAKQINIIETFMLKQPKVLLVSPVTESVQTAIEKAYDAGTPVILLDRAIPGDKYTTLIGGDNVEIGREAAKFIVEKLDGKGTVLMIQGLGGATATTDRREGALEIFKQHPGIKVKIGDDCKYQRNAAKSYMENFLQSGEPFDAVYAHNDEMAIGAFLAWEGSPNVKPGGKRPLFVGVDACQQEIVEMIKAGKIDATFKYPIPGPRGVQLAAEILEGKQPTEKKIILPTERVTMDTADKYLSDNPNLAK